MYLIFIQNGQKLFFINSRRNSFLQFSPNVHVSMLFLQPRPLPMLDSNRQFCLCACMSAALAQLTDKIDSKCIIPSESARCHNEEKKHVGHLGFLRKRQKNAF